jgi:hypothetical protein
MGVHCPRILIVCFLHTRMKPKILIILATVAVLLPLLSSTLQAQEQLLFRVNVPFEFIAGGVHLSSGQYLAFHVTPNMIQLTRVDGRANAYIAVKGLVMNGNNGNRIIFNKYGETYFLAQVQTGHDQQTHECFQCRGEKTLAARYRPSEAFTLRTRLLVKWPFIANNPVKC